MMTKIQRTLASVIVRSGSGALLLKRAQPYAEFIKHDPSTQLGMGLWELPGGGVEFGETPQEAVVREASEEIGLLFDQKDIKLTDCCAYTLKGSKCESHRIHVVYEVNMNAPVQVLLSKEHVAHVWARDADALQGLKMIDEIRKVVVASF